MTSIVIVGAGGVGGTIAAKLAAIGETPTLVARGAHGEALSRDGLTFTDQNGTTHYDVPATTDISSLGTFDVIIVSTKATSHNEVLPTLTPLMHENSVVLPACNGLPWWFLEQQGVREGGTIPLEQIVGMVCYNAASVVAPGHVQNIGHPRVLLGEIAGGTSARVNRLAGLFERAGYRDVAREEIRIDMLDKLCWNVSFNPLSVIHRMDSAELATNPETRQLIADMIAEMGRLATALTIPLKVDAEKHIILGEKAGHHKPSMLQDFEASKPLEVDALIGDVVKLAQSSAQSLPQITRVYHQLLAAL